MTVAILDLLKGSRARLCTKGWELTQPAMVSGLDEDGAMMLIAAGMHSAMPKIGSSHPSVPFLILEEIVPEWIGGDKVRLQLVYRSPEGSSPTDENSVGEVSIENNSTTQQVETYEDADRQLLRVSYTNSSDPPVTKSDVKKISAMRPRQTKSFEWVSDDDASDLAEMFSGRVNLKSWRHDPGCAARTWLCTGIVARSSNGGITYTVTATFEKNDEPPTNNWDVTLVYHDPTTGKPPGDDPAFGDGNGKETFQMYSMIDFNALPF